MTKATNKMRTTAGLRDILFDEIEELRGPEGNPQRAIAVAKLARQIISTAEVEMEFHRTAAALPQPGALAGLGTLQLGSR